MQVECKAYTKTIKSISPSVIMTVMPNQVYASLITDGHYKSEFATKFDVKQ